MFLFPWHLDSEVCVPGSKSLQGHADEFMSQYLEKQVGLTLHMTCDTRPWNGQLTTRQWSSICFTRNRGCLVESWKGRKKVWISKYRWSKCTSWDGCKKLKHCDYSYHVYDIWTFMISAAGGILFINRTTTGLTAFWCLYCILIIAFQCLLGFCGMFLCSQLQHHYH